MSGGLQHGLPLLLHGEVTDPKVDVFDREKVRGMRLDIAAGTAVRFEPGQSRQVELVELAGQRRVFGFAGRVMGDL